LKDAQDKKKGELGPRGEEKRLAQIPVEAREYVGRLGVRTESQVDAINSRRASISDFIAQRRKYDDFAESRQKISGLAGDKLFEEKQIDGVYGIEKRNPLIEQSFGGLKDNPEFIAGLNGLDGANFSAIELKKIASKFTANAQAGLKDIGIAPTATERGRIQGSPEAQRVLKEALQNAIIEVSKESADETRRNKLDPARAKVAGLGVDFDDLAKSGPKAEEKFFASIDALKGKRFEELGTNLDNATKRFKDLTDSIGELQQRINALTGGAPKYELPFEGPQFLGLAAGGSVFKPRGTDTVPAMLTPGEFIVNAASARANAEVLHSINEARGPLYRAAGGLAKLERFPSLPPTRSTPVRTNTDDGLDAGFEKYAAEKEYAPEFAPVKVRPAPPGIDATGYTESNPLRIGGNLYYEAPKYRANGGPIYRAGGGRVSFFGGPGRLDEDFVNLPGEASGAFAGGIELLPLAPIDGPEPIFDDLLSRPDAPRDGIRKLAGASGVSFLGGSRPAPRRAASVGLAEDAAFAGLDIGDDETLQKRVRRDFEVASGDEQLAANEKAEKAKKGSIFLPATDPVRTATNTRGYYNPYGQQKLTAPEAYKTQSLPTPDAYKRRYFYNPYQRQQQEAQAAFPADALAEPVYNQYTGGVTRNPLVVNTDINLREVTPEDEAARLAAKVARVQPVQAAAKPRQNIFDKYGVQRRRTGVAIQYRAFGGLIDGVNDAVNDATNLAIFEEQLAKKPFVGKIQPRPLVPEFDPFQRELDIGQNEPEQTQGYDISDRDLKRQLRFQAASNPGGASALLLTRQRASARAGKFTKNESKIENYASRAVLAQHYRTSVGNFASRQRLGGDQNSIAANSLTKQFEFNNLAARRDFGAEQVRQRIVQPQYLPIGATRPLGFATGGTVPGVGQGDVVPAMLTPGEFVVPANAAARIGTSRLQGFANGGVVGTSQSSGSGSSGGLGLSPEVAQAFSQFNSTLTSFNANFGQSIQSLSQSFTGFAGNATALADAINKMPRELTTRGQMQVTVVHNGAQLFAGLTPEIQKMVEVQTRDALAKMLKEHLPDAGVTTV
jgi:hypothetical protein